MISLLLAATLLQSVDPAVEKMLADQAAQIQALERQQVRYQLQARREADAVASCIKEAFWLHGGDLGATAAGLKFCPECRESNPLGFNTEARVGLKIAALGVAVAECYRSAKDGGTGKLQWVNRGITGTAILVNVINAIAGRSVLGWGVEEKK